MSLVNLLSPRGPSGFSKSSTAEDVTQGVNLAGKTYLVSGSNSGLGLETLRVLSLRGARVVVLARSLEKAKEAAATVKGPTLPIACELSDPKSVRAAVEEVKRQGLLLDGIICNAGVMAMPKVEKAHGYELQFFTNHIGHFILVTGLMDRLTPDGRVVMLSSEGHRQARSGGIEFDNLDGSKGYGPWRFYGQSKFANILFAKELARRLEGTKKTANAVHPGVIHTNLSRHMNPVVDALFKMVAPMFCKNVHEGAATQVYVATHPSLAGVSGKYFADSNEKKPRADAENMETAKRLWDESEKIVAKLGG
jgi:WW domain-containing oxidoreductase